MTLAKGFANQAGISYYTWMNTECQMAVHLSGAAALPPTGQICPLAYNKNTHTDVALPSPQPFPPLFSFSGGAVQTKVVFS